MRESVAQLAFWDHERAEFAKFERDLAKHEVIPLAFFLWVQKPLRNCK